MWAFTMIALLALQVQAHAEDVADMDMLVNKLAGKLLDRSLEAEYSGDLDDSTLAKPTQLAGAGALTGTASVATFPIGGRDMVVCEAARRYKKKKFGGVLPIIPPEIEDTPYHQRSKFLSTSLSKELKKEHGTRSLPLRTGDELKVLTGPHEGHTGKVTKVFRKYGTITLEGLTKDKYKKDIISNEYAMTTVPIYLYPHKCRIITLSEDKDRDAIIARRKKTKEMQAAR